MRKVWRFPGNIQKRQHDNRRQTFRHGKTEAADFSFLLSVPVILGSGMLEFYEALSSGAAIQIAPVAAGTVAAFLSGLAALTFMINTVKKHNFWPFAAYTAVLSVVSFFVL